MKTAGPVSHTGDEVVGEEEEGVSPPKKMLFANGDAANLTSGCAV